MSIKVNDLSIAIASLDSSEWLTGSALQKLLASYFIGNNNRPSLIIDIQKELSSDKFINVSYGEIAELSSLKHIFKSDSEYVENATVCLMENVYQDLKSIYEKNNINYLITEFVTETKQVMSIDNIRKILLNFLYAKHQEVSELFFSNGQIRRHLQSGDESTVESDADKKVVNDFLKWDNDRKNTFVFNFINHSIEYKLLNNANNEVSKSFVNGIAVYLDTNILFRALGLNGDVRRHKVIQMFDIIKKNKIKTFVSIYTHNEFMDSIDFHMKCFQEYQITNPEIIDDFQIEEDFVKYFLNWKKQNPGLTISRLKVYIISLLEEFLNTYEIEISKNTIDFALPDYHIKRYEYARSIAIAKSGKRKKSILEETQANIQDGFDAENIILHGSLNPSAITSISECKSIFLTSDHLLQEWFHLHNKSFPTIYLPSHWLAVLLLLTGRSQDDYATFTKYIECNYSNNSLISNDKLLVVLAGIQSTTPDTMQKGILRTYIDTKIKEIVRTGDKETIFNNSKKYAESEMAKKIQEIESNQKAQASQTAALKEKSQQEIAAIKSQMEEQEKKRIQLEELHQKDKADLVVSSRLESIDNICQGLVNGSIWPWRLRCVFFGMMLIIISAYIFLFNLFSNKLNILNVFIFIKSLIDMADVINQNVYATAVYGFSAFFLVMGGYNFKKAFSITDLASFKSNKFLKEKERLLKAMKTSS